MMPRPDSPEALEKFRKKMAILSWVTLVVFVSIAVAIYFHKPQEAVTTVQFMDLQEVMYLPVRPAKLVSEEPETVSPPAIELPRNPYTRDIVFGGIRFRGAIIYMTLDAISPGSHYMALTPVQCLTWAKDREDVDGVILKWSESKEDLLAKSVMPDYLQQLKKRTDLPYVIRIKE